MYNDYKRLLAYAKAKYAEREDHEDKQKRRYERDKLIDEAPEFADLAFNCSLHGDFFSRGYKVVRSDKDPSESRIAFYQSIKTAKGTCGHARRYITDKHLDPYYKNSELVQIDRQQLAIDLLQPNDPNYAKYWGNPYKKFEEAQAEQEQKDWEAKRKL